MKGKKIIIVLVIIILILLAAVGFLLWKYVINDGKTDKKEDTTQKQNEVVNTVDEPEKDVEFELGKYKIDLDSFASEAEEPDVVYGDYTLEFKEDDEMILYEGWGITGKGTYEISDKKVKCSVTSWETESGAYAEFETEPVEINLKIEDENTLVVSSVSGKGEVTKVIKSDKDFAGKAMGLEDTECFAKGAKYVLSDGDDEKDKLEELEYGTYEVDLETVKYDKEDENLYKDVSFKISANNEVEVYIGEGTTGTGTYEVSDNEVKFLLTDWESESGGYFKFVTTPVEIVLEIKDDDTYIVKSTESGDVTKVVEESGTFGREDVDLSRELCFKKGVEFVKK